MNSLMGSFYHQLLSSVILHLCETYESLRDGQFNWKLRNLYQGKRWLTWSIQGILSF